MIDEYFSVEHVACVLCELSKRAAALSDLIFFGLDVGFAFHKLSSSSNSVTSVRDASSSAGKRKAESNEEADEKKKKPLC